ncbi:MAG TPA: 30S ribosomal protein S8 [Bacteroidetes bacterium]|mgnify:CR=1 FL=1|nr:30S ribosomal protein S8 [Ignavibacteria bacterium]HCA43441.1 30S ribosomal protein S8 [Bacteroidota bacterium]HCN36112.1 30S ribosomal protein S8 [Bacteroidota bacterium]
MSMTDPISDFLTRVRNAIKAEKKTVDIPASKFKKEIAEILKNTKFIEDYKIVDVEAPQKMLSIRLKYSNGESVITGIKKISKPGIRRYVQTENLPKVRNGLGIALISTSKGLMTDAQARKLGVGGEVICEVW